MEVLGTLGIDWKLFVAQLVNFGIVLFIFWKWVVTPLGKALMDRQKKIDSGLKNADLMEKEKAGFDAWKKQEMHKTRVEAEEIIKKAQEAANVVKTEIVSNAHSQAAQMIEETKISLAQQKDATMKEIKQEVATLVVAASEKILRGKLDEKKDHELISESIKSIK